MVLVWRAVNRETQVPAAMKQLDKRTMPSRNVRKEDIEREVRMMKACNHVNITQCFHFFEDARYLYLALEYCDGGDFGDKVTPEINPCDPTSVRQRLSTQREQTEQSGTRDTDLKAFLVC